MPTLRQRKLAEAIVENSKKNLPLNKSALLESVGYDRTTARAMPTRTLEQPGVQEALADLGFTEENAKNVVAEIMLNPDADDSARLKAASEVFKVKGSYAAEKTVALQVNLEPRSGTESDLEAVRAQFEEQLKRKLLE